MSTSTAKHFLFYFALSVAIVMGLTYSAVPAHADDLNCKINDGCYIPGYGGGICLNTYPDTACDCFLFASETEMHDNFDCAGQFQE